MRRHGPGGLRCPFCHAAWAPGLCAACEGGPEAPPGGCRTPERHTAQRQRCLRPQTGRAKRTTACTTCWEAQNRLATPPPQTQRGHCLGVCSKTWRPLRRRASLAKRPGGQRVCPGGATALAAQDVRAREAPGPEEQGGVSAGGGGSPRAEGAVSPPCPFSVTAGAGLSPLQAVPSAAELRHPLRRGQERAPAQRGPQHHEG